MLPMIVDGIDMEDIELIKESFEMMVKWTGEMKDSASDSRKE